MNDKATLPNLARANLGEEVYQVLRSHIFSYRYDIGERLDLNEIGRQLGISRTPLKSAVDRLASEGLLKIVPRRGTYVVAPSLETIDNAFAMREVLECYAIRLSIERITDKQLDRLAELIDEMVHIAQESDHSSMYPLYAELDHDFHELIIKAADNNVLLELWQRTLAHIQVARGRYRRQDRDIVDPTTKTHQSILDALRARDAEQAEMLIREHIERARALLNQDFHSLNQSGTTRADLAG